MKLKHLFICLVMFLFSAGSARPAFAAKRDVSGVLSNVIGTVQIKHTGSEAWANLKIGDFVYEGDSVKTGARSRAMILFANGVESRMHANTMLKVRPKELGKNSNTSLEMSLGKLWNKVLRQKTKFDIHTPVATISVRGTEYESDVDDKGETTCKCYDGEVEMGNEFGIVRIRKGTMSHAGAGQAPKEAEKMGDTDKSTWQDEVKTTGGVKITLANGEAKLNEEVSGAILIVDSKGKPDTAYAKEINITCDNSKVQLEKVGDTKWQSAIALAPSKGELSFKIKSTGFGVTNVSAIGEGLAASMVSFEVKAPPNKNLTIKIKDENGVEKQLLLKFKAK